MLMKSRPGGLACGSFVVHLGCRVEPSSARSSASRLRVCMDGGTSTNKHTTEPSSLRYRWSSPRGFWHAGRSKEVRCQCAFLDVSHTRLSPSAPARGEDTALGLGVSSHLLARLLDLLGQLVAAGVHHVQIRLGERRLQPRAQFSTTISATFFFSFLVDSPIESHSRSRAQFEIRRRNSKKHSRTCTALPASVSEKENRRFFSLCCAWYRCILSDALYARFSCVTSHINHQSSIINSNPRRE